MFARLTGIPNRPLLYDIYQYIWDAKETCMLLDSYISWLGKFINHKFTLCVSICLTEAGGYEVRKEGYLPSTVEPFVFKGGITAEMQVLAILYTGNAALRIVYFHSDFYLPWIALKICTHSRRLRIHHHLFSLFVLTDQKTRY